MFRVFEALVPEFTTLNWTSSLRRYAFPELAAFNDGDSYSDFTYHDYTGIMAALLDISTDRPKTFHVEVKTSKARENGFAFSSRQLNTVQNTYTKRIR